MTFAIQWCGGFVTCSQRKPYTTDLADPTLKTWKTRRAAERFLSLKDPSWAAGCTIVEVPKG